MPSITIVAGLVHALAAVVPGGDAPPGIAFGPPRIVRLEPGTHSPKAADFDSDGLVDLAVVNNAKARIDLLLQRREGTFTAPDPDERNVPADDPLFEKRSLLTEKRVSSMVVGDFDSDGRADVAFYGEPKSLVVAYQGDAGSFERRREYDVRDGSSGARALDAGDLDGDGRTDLVLLAETDVVIITQGEKGAGLGEPTRVASALKDVGFVRVADLSGDGRADLLLASGDDPRPIRVRHQRADGTIGPELAFRSPPVRAIATRPPADVGKAATLLVVPQASGLVRELRFEPEKEAEGGIVLARPRLFPFGGAKGPKRRSVAVGDVDGDGRADVVATDPAAARVLLYRQSATGELSGPEAYPAYREATSVRIADADGNGTADAVLLSPDEKSVGFMSWESGRLTFPKPIDVGGTPMALDAADLDGDGRADVVVATKQDKATRISMSFGGAEGRVDAPLEGAGEVSGVRVADLDGDGNRDVVVFFPADPVRVLRGLGKRGFAEIPAGALFKETSVKDLTAASAAIDDLDGDGREELVFATKNTARAVRVKESGALAVLDQLNGRAGASFLGVVAADLDGDGKPEAVAYDDESKSLVVLRRGAGGVFEVARTLETGAFDFAGLLAADVTGDGREDVLLVGTEKLGVVPAGVADVGIAEGTPYESAERNAVLTNLLCEELGPPPGAEIVVLDVRNYRVEILGASSGEEAGKSEDAWKRLFAWKVFETKTFEAEGRGGEEPHASCVADVTADGRRDLILLVHDRVLIYPAL